MLSGRGEFGAPEKKGLMVLARAKQYDKLPQLADVGHS